MLATPPLTAPTVGFGNIVALELTALMVTPVEIPFICVTLLAPPVARICSTGICTLANFLAVVPTLKSSIYK